MTDPRFTCGNLQLRETLGQVGYSMSGCFDGRNGKSVKTSGDLKDLRDLQFEEICWNWNCRRFIWQVFF